MAFHRQHAFPGIPFSGCPGDKGQFLVFICTRRLTLGLAAATLFKLELLPWLLLDSLLSCLIVGRLSLSKLFTPGA